MRCRVSYSPPSLCTPLIHISVVPAGANTSSIARPTLGSVPYGADIYDCNVAGQAALTYDDGPYIYTAELLDLLKEYNAKATFFITGINLGKGSIDSEATGYPALIRRMAAEGHQIASHTWSHADLSTVSPLFLPLLMMKEQRLI